MDRDIPGRGRASAEAFQDNATVAPRLRTAAPVEVDVFLQRAWRVRVRDRSPEITVSA
jgi:hypothetical protein